MMAPNGDVYTTPDCIFDCHTAQGTALEHNDSNSNFQHKTVTSVWPHHYEHSAALLRIAHPKEAVSSGGLRGK